MDLRRSDRSHPDGAIDIRYDQFKVSIMRGRTAGVDLMPIDPASDAAGRY
jgi:hypothetical protein